MKIYGSLSTSKVKVRARDVDADLSLILLGPILGHTCTEEGYDTYIRG